MENSNNMGLLLVVCATISCISLASGEHVPPNHVTYKQEGDLLLGGLFPIHETGETGERCGSLREKEALHRVEAMAFAVEEINNRTDILPNVTLGFEIRDTCTDISTTQIGALKFLPSHFTREGTCQVTNDANITDMNQPIIGVVGTEMSSTTMSAAQLLGLNHLPVVSYFATSDDLSDESQYPYFLRVVPPDRLQVQAMLDIIKLYGWSYINVLYSGDSYGTNAYQEIVQSLEYMDVCLAAAIEIGEGLSEAEYDGIVMKMQEKPQARVVILFVQVEHANNFLSAVRRLGVVGEYQILGSDGWGMSIGEIEVINRRSALGSLKTHLFSAHVEEFENYFLRLKPNNSTENPWFEEFGNSERNCSFIKYGAFCLSEPGFSAGSAVSLVIDAVYTMALGLSQMHQALCQGQDGICSAMMPFDSALLFDYMKNVSFTGRSGDMTFDSGGDAIGRYIIENIQVKHGNYELVRVGIWSAIEGHFFRLNDSEVTWGVDKARMANEIPLSYCSDPCTPGQIYIPRENDCCWTCFNCSEDEITMLNQSYCVECDHESYPNDEQIRCVPVEAEYILWNSPLAIMLTVIALAGLIFCSVVVFFYIRNRQNMLIKASSRELCFIILFGIYLSYILVFALIAKPSKATCLVCRMMLMLSFTIIYAPLLTRVNRIYRIFNSGKKSVRRPGCISPSSQVTIALIIISAQVIMNSIWLLLIPPAAEKITVAPRKVELTCNFTSGEIIASLSYNFILISLCSTFAFMTRKVPNNYNESRFIALCVYTVLVIWIGFISSYFAINDSHLQVVVLSLAMICNGTVTLSFMFLSKLYAIYFDKEVVISATIYDGSGRAGGLTMNTNDGKDELNENCESVSKKGSSMFRRSTIRPSGDEIPPRESYVVSPKRHKDIIKKQFPSQENVCATISGSGNSTV